MDVFRQITQVLHRLRIVPLERGISHAAPRPEIDRVDLPVGRKCEEDKRQENDQRTILIPQPDPEINQQDQQADKHRSQDTQPKLCGRIEHQHGRNGGGEVGKEEQGDGEGDDFPNQHPIFSLWRCLAGGGSRGEGIRYILPCFDGQPDQQRAQDEHNRSFDDERLLEDLSAPGFHRDQRFGNGAQSNADIFICDGMPGKCTVRCILGGQPVAKGPAQDPRQSARNEQGTGNEFFPPALMQN